MSNQSLAIRNLTINDIPLIVDYFLNADEKYLLQMGCDACKFPSRKAWIELLENNFFLTDYQKEFYYIIWLLGHEPVGHSNINKIVPNESAYMHLHFWHSSLRKKGLGVQFVIKCLPEFFQIFNLKTIYCEPYSLNPAPNKVLEKIGFELIQTYTTTPGWLNFEQKVNKWCLTKEKLNLIIHD